MKLCVFGGTFDPPHIGHLLIAQTIFEAEQFNKIVFIPAYQPPHKEYGKLSSIELRLKMLELAVVENPNFIISHVEIRRKGISYSIDTVKEIRSQYNLETDDLYFLIGSDTLADIINWKDPRRLVKECQVIVAIRPGFRPSAIPSWLLDSVRFANVPRFEISSTVIRQRWRQNKTIRYMVTQPVWEFINEQNLYT
ncbi:MAG: nicotinate-nucleotide adenylyltransferase [Candidatus Marinimicrobia bacterium]|nr:nicotinate-nucleotide adenylyltransferase [Candidatus Neomarinimicrobiota bacterium]